MKTDFSIRHPSPELLDGDNIPEQELFKNYRELHLINKYLGGYAITLKGISELMSGNKKFSVLDIGCGGGDMLMQIQLWGKKNKLDLKLTGIDLNETAIKYSKHNCSSFPEITWITTDVFDHLEHCNRYDIITGTLFFHHFTDESIRKLITMALKKSSLGIVINDLHRCATAYYSIGILAALFSGSYLVRNDAPLSVARGFLKKELMDLADKSGAADYRCVWKWAFRYLLIIKGGYE